jgi:hypothetical protein
VLLTNLLTSKPDLALSLSYFFSGGGLGLATTLGCLSCPEEGRSRVLLFSSSLGVFLVGVGDFLPFLTGVEALPVFYIRYYI